MMYQNAFQTSPPVSLNINDLPSLLFGEEFQLLGDTPIQIDLDTDIIYIHLSLKNDPAHCPNCGSLTTHPHDYPLREVQLLPLNGKTTYAVIHRTSWECHNPDCSCKTFSTDISSVESYAHRSLSLNIFIFSLSIFCSASSAAMICRQLGIIVSDDSILRMYKRIVIEDNPDVEFVGIDDIANRKGMDYYTVIYDGETHHILAMLEGRDGEALKVWLKAHPKINKVCRDRAGAYAKAIAEILPGCLQIADKFHLFQNLLGYLKDIFKANLPDKFFFKNGKELLIAPDMVYEYLPALNKEEADRYKYDNSPPIDNNRNIIKYDSKLRDLDCKQYREQEARRIEKYERAVNIRAEWFSEGRSSTKKELCKKYGISYPNLNKIINLKDEEVPKILERREYKKRVTIMDEYINIIYKMLSDGIDHIIIFRYIRYLGYDKNLNTLSNYIRKFAKNNFSLYIDTLRFKRLQYPLGIDVITRNEVLKYMTIKDKDKMKETDVAKYYLQIKENHPVIKACDEIWTDFSQMMDQTDPEALDEFIKKNDEGLIQPFINGIKRDSNPVKNTISYSDTSGFVEGQNNRIKSTKRFMFGRCNIELLFRKTYAISSIFHLDKSVKEIGNF